MSDVSVGISESSSSSDITSPLDKAEGEQNSVLDSERLKEIDQNLSSDKDEPIVETPKKRKIRKSEESFVRYPPPPSDQESDFASDEDAGNSTSKAPEKLDVMPNNDAVKCQENEFAINSTTNREFTDVNKKLTEGEKTKESEDNKENNNEKAVEKSGLNDSNSCSSRSFHSKSSSSKSNKEESSKMKIESKAEGNQEDAKNRLASECISSRNNSSDKNGTNHEKINMEKNFSSTKDKSSSSSHPKRSNTSSNKAKSTTSNSEEDSPNVQLEVSEPSNDNMAAEHKRDGSSSSSSKSVSSDDQNGKSKSSSKDNDSVSEKKSNNNVANNLPPVPIGKVNSEKSETDAPKGYVVSVDFDNSPRAPDPSKQMEEAGEEPMVFSPAETRANIISDLNGAIPDNNPNNSACCLLI